MKSIVAPKFVCPDVATLVKMASTDDAFKQSNHDGELLYIQVQDAEGLTPLCTEQGRPVLIPCPFKYEEIRHQLRIGKHMVFLTVDSFRDSFVRVESVMKVQEVVFMQEMEYQGNSRFFYYGEDPRGDVLRAMKSKPSCVVKAYVEKMHGHANLIFPRESMEEAKEFEVAFREIKKKKLLYVSGMLMPTVVVQKERGSPPRRVVQTDILVNDWWVKDDTYADVEKIIAKVNSVDDVTFFRDLKTGEPLYPEYVRKMMWYSTMYVKMGDPVFNLIISGDPGVAKSTALAVYARIFSVTAKVLIGSGGTKKGLIPSFSGDVPREGALVKEPWFAPVDEFFTISSSEAVALGVERIANMHRQYIRDLLPVITRSPLRYPSAKDDEFECVMEASLMATDNLVQKTREALKVLVEEDPAVLRRFCVVWLGTDVKSRVRQSPSGSVDDNMRILKKFWLENYGFPVTEMKRLGEWCRGIAADIQVDGTKCLDMQRDVMSDLVYEALEKDGTLEDVDVVDAFCRSVDFSVHIMGIVRCEALMRAVYASKGELPKVKVEEEDYNSAKELFKRVMRDSMFLFDTAIWSVSGGVKRI